MYFPSRVIRIGLLQNKGQLQINSTAKMRGDQAKSDQVYTYWIDRVNGTAWTYDWGGLANLLSIFIFWIYLFIRLIVSVYMLMIYKWSEIRARYVFWLDINEIQPSKFIGKNRNLFFLDSALFFSFLYFALYEVDL